MAHAYGIGGHLALHPTAPCSAAVKIKSWATHRVELPELTVPELAAVLGGHAKA